MLLGFQARFAADVESGKKCQTIRAPRRDGRLPRVGERVYLYTAQRTQQSRKLGDGVSVEAVEIDAWPTVVVYGEEDGELLVRSRPWQLLVKIAWGGICARFMNGVQAEAFARSDGFASGDEMAEWFRRVYGLPFTGHLIRWRLLPREEWK